MPLFLLLSFSLLFFLAGQAVNLTGPFQAYLHSGLPYIQRQDLPAEEYRLGLVPADLWNRSLIITVALDTETL